MSPCLHEILHMKTLCNMVYQAMDQAGNFFAIWLMLNQVHQMNLCQPCEHVAFRAKASRGKKQDTTVMRAGCISY